MKTFKGIFPALLTPFYQNGKVNYSALKQLIEMNLEKGVDGFYVCGSSAEAFLMEDQMRKEILEHVIEYNAGRGTIIAHIGTISQKRAEDLARHAERAGADAVSSIPPFYYGFDFQCICRYYFAVADAVNLPVILYNFPANSGVKLTLENVRVFLEDPRFLGVKHTSSDFLMLQQIKAVRNTVIVYNGYDEMFLSGIAAGADGGIGSTYNFMAEKFIAIRNYMLAGNLEQAQSIQKQVNNIICELIRLGVLPAAKAVLSFMGIDMGDCLKPFPTLDEGDKVELRKVLQANGCTLG